MLQDNTIIILTTEGILGGAGIALIAVNQPTYAIGLFMSMIAFVAGHINGSTRQSPSPA